MLNFLLENFRLGLKNLALHKLRSLLTAMGIIFGVMAVIIMVAIGEGTKQEALEQMRALGANNILVRSTPPPESTDASQGNQRVLRYGLKRVDLERLRSLGAFRRVVPVRDTEQKVVYGNVRANANAIATTPEWFDVINLRPARGQAFNQVHYDRAESVCVLGAEAAKQLFPYQDPIGRPVQVGSSSSGVAVLTVIGVLQPTGLRQGSDSAGITQRDIDADVYFPLTVARNVFSDLIVKRQSGSFVRKEIELSEVWLQADSIDQVEALAGVAENVVLNGADRRLDVVTKAPIEILRNAQRLNNLFNFILVGIASFSLVVGGIGIMNIMLATVTERTKEIGIRRALGAKRSHITLQFLIETTVISLTGGLIGIALGAFASYALPLAVTFFLGERYPTQIATWSVVGSFAVSGLIGVGCRRACTPRVQPCGGG